MRIFQKKERFFRNRSSQIFAAEIYGIVKYALRFKTGGGENWTIKIAKKLKTMKCDVYPFSILSSTSICGNSLLSGPSSATAAFVACLSNNAFGIHPRLQWSIKVLISGLFKAKICSLLTVHRWFHCCPVKIIKEKRSFRKPAALVLPVCSAHIKYSLVVHHPRIWTNAEYHT